MQRRALYPSAFILYPFPVTIGILGGGQLARMLALAGYPLGLQFKIFDAAPDAPAGQLAPLLAEDPNDTPALLWFSRGLDAITYEWENVPVSSTRYLNQRVPVYPPPRALEIAQDRQIEKSFFRDLGVPVPPFEAVETREELENAVAKSGLPAILKTRRFGYDGKGQFRLQNARDIEKAWQELGGVPLILEGFVPFTRELSILVARARNGEKQFYPLVENHHSQGILRLSIAPAPDTENLQATAQDYISRIADELDYVGVLALELFQVGDDLIANEIAPRVHNSGHWTIEGSQTSQFENHLRAVAALPLGATAMKAPFAAMINLIGVLPPLCDVLQIPGAHAHYYGKEVKPNRKVGHITVVAQTMDELRERIEAARKLAN